MGLALNSVWYGNILRIIYTPSTYLSMQRSHLFAHVELAKLASSLTDDIAECRSRLISSQTYFTLITEKMLSKSLTSEWRNICSDVSRSGPLRDSEGRVVVNAVKNTIRNMHTRECVSITKRIQEFQRKLAAELEQSKSLFITPHMMISKWGKSIFSYNDFATLWLLSHWEQHSQDLPLLATSNKLTFRFNYANFEVE